MNSYVIAYRSLELLFGTHTFHFNCFFEDFNCVFTQICCLSRVLIIYLYFSSARSQPLGKADKNLGIDENGSAAGLVGPI